MAAAAWQERRVLKVVPSSDGPEPWDLPEQTTNPGVSHPQPLLPPTQRPNPTWFFPIQSQRLRHRGTHCVLLTVSANLLDKWPSWGSLGVLGEPQATPDPTFNHSDPTLIF